MAVGFASINVENRTIIILKGYPTIYDGTCDEIRKYAKELGLYCLQYLDGASNCMFNYDQCQNILNTEIPFLRSKDLSKDAQIALNNIEEAIKESNNPYGYLYFEGD